jgi:hypothetical protein
MILYIRTTLVLARLSTEYDYKLHDQKLEVTKDSKYLGVTISTELSWTSHINNIYAKANRTISFSF